MNTQRILILGGTGMLGHVMWQQLVAQFPETYVTVRQPLQSYASYGLTDRERVIDEIDALDSGRIHGLLKGLRPAFVLNCIGITKRYIGEHNVAECIQLNAQLPHALAKMGAKTDSKIINFSTDCVFDGSRGDYGDDENTDATDIYGKTKALGEIRYRNALTLRSSFIGRELKHRTELLEWFLSQEGREVRGFKNAIYSGVTTLELSRIVMDILVRHKDLHGLYNISGPKISKYELLLLIKARFDLAIDVVADESLKCDRSLDSTRFRSVTGYQPPGWDAMVSELADWSSRSQHP